ncbi:hypothetical protein EDB87DRAFT_1725308 [Lactarius vividus]|nr:hypothetical protein EDB87DRAFT_1725308 [Lactarius vividus]
MPLPLPIEIVVCILESFVAFPDVMDTSAPRYAIYPNGFLPLDDIKRSIRSLSLLALVCRQWNTIYTPILYRCLVVDDSTVMNVLLNTLQRSHTTTHASALSDRHTHSHEVEPLEIRILKRFGDLGKLACCLPHLQILSISIAIPAVLGLPMPYYGRDFAASITRTSARSLRKLFLYQNPVVLFSRPELHALLESTPNLVALIGADYIGCPAALPFLPKLKYLAVSGEASTSPPTDHFDCSQILGSLCPNISRLEIFITNWHCFPQLDWLPSVEDLDIHLIFSGVTVTDICKTLAGIQSPSLKVIRFLDPEMDKWLASPQSGNVDSAWGPLLKIMFRVVNHDGHQLGPSGRPLEGNVSLNR